MGCRHRRDGSKIMDTTHSGLRLFPFLFLPPYGTDLGGRDVRISRLGRPGWIRHSAIRPAGADDGNAMAGCRSRKSRASVQARFPITNRPMAVSPDGESPGRERLSVQRALTSTLRKRGRHLRAFDVSKDRYLILYGWV